MNKIRLLSFLIILACGIARAQLSVSPSGGAGTVDWSASRLIAAPAMSPAHQINVTKIDQSDAITANATMTLSATPAANTWFGFKLTADASGPYTITLPAGTWVSESRGIITTFALLASQTATISVDYDGSVYRLYGDPAKGSFTTTKQTAANYTVGTADPDELYGGVIYVTAAATITLPAVAPGMTVTVITKGAVAVSVDCNGADLIVRDGTTQADGEKITNTSTTGDIAVLTYYDATGWYAATNSWTNGG